MKNLIVIILAVIIAGCGIRFEYTPPATFALSADVAYLQWKQSQAAAHPATQPTTQGAPR